MKMDRRKYIGMLGTAVSIGLAGCSGGDTDSESGGADSGDSSESGGANSNSDEGPAVIREHEWYQEDYSAGVKGIVENISDRELGYIQVTANFYDSDGTKIDDGLANTNDLSSGRKWEFDCVYLGEEPGRVAEYELTLDA